MRVADLAHGRSGDKGDICNVGIVAYDDGGYAVLRRELTAERVKAHYGDLVTRHRDAATSCPNIRALNFVLTGALDGGGTLSLRSDHLGKAMYAWLLRMEIPARCAVSDRSATLRGARPRPGARRAAREPRPGHDEPARAAQPARPRARRPRCWPRFRNSSPTTTVRSVAVDRRPATPSAPGGDLRQMGRFRTMPVDAAMAWPSAIIDLHKLMLDAPKPVVAAVDGPAYAGGMGLAGMCDIVLATTRARFALPEVRLGLFPMIIVAHLVRAMPRKILLEMMLTGEPIDAAEAHRVGLVNRVYDDRAALFKGLDEYAAAFDRASPQALRLGRKALALLAELPPAQSLDAAYFLNLPFFLGDDLAEGAAAFLERRSPRWLEEFHHDRPRTSSPPSVPRSASVTAACPASIRPTSPLTSSPRCFREPGSKTVVRSTTSSSAASARSARRRPTSRGPPYSRPGCPSRFPVPRSTASAARPSRPFTSPPRPSCRGPRIWSSPAGSR